MSRTYGALAYRGDSWVVSDLEPHVAIRFKANFPKVPKHSPGPFKLPADGVTAADLAWFISRYPLAATPHEVAGLEGARRGYEQVQAEAGRIMSADYQPPLYAGLRPGQAVRQHQAQAAEIVHRLGGLLTADDVGEGKTYTGAATLLLPGALPGTVVCPPHLAIQWAQKLAEFTTLKPHIIRGTKPYALPPCDVRIFSYTQLSGWIDFIADMGSGASIFDEIHKLRHGLMTATGEGAMRLSEVSRYKLGLSATPIFNYGDEIWNVMRFLRPEVLGERGDFLREWCGGGGAVTDPEALGAYLYDQRAMLRKRGSAPPANVMVQTISHDVRELESVEDLARALAMRVRNGPAMDRGRSMMELDMLLRQQTGVAKAKTVAQFVRLLVESGRPVVLFGWHRQVYQIWLRELAEFNPVLFTGTESPKQKEASKQAFIDGWSKVLIMSLRSGEGMDGIQSICRTAVIGELDWTESVHKQCIGRINREGQTAWPDRVDAYFLIADDGADPAMVDVVGLKASQLHGIVDPGLEPAQGGRDNSPLERLVERYIDKGRAAA